ncbi:hypothetical protein C6A37_00415 [Desulfobacteraceae bacterium SEEP-SAG9]|nr:hypothetical protein C6A37_00415 [Desulfobacteraceae bacterium SEEP-SAG9]
MPYRTYYKLVSKLIIMKNYIKQFNSKNIIDEFINIVDNPFFVSFPRTGSHWLRMLMELYFERPLLTRTFYYADKDNYLLLHTHDLELDVNRHNVIYIYRDPVDTIYSQLKYHKEDSKDRIIYWSDLYGRHLDKWLHQETVTQKKTVIRYEKLKGNMPAEFGKICSHFNVGLDVDRLIEIASQVSKEKVKEKATHDLQVVNLVKSYEDARKTFRKKHGDFVWNTFLNDREHLEKDF